MTHKTKGIVLKTIKYGETSLVVTAYTELFGLQTYLVKGVRIQSKRGMGKANVFQPGALLEMVVYHNELKNLQFIKEFKWSHLYQNLYSDVIKNSVAVFMIELITKSIREPETNAELFYFVENNLILLDEAEPRVTANLPLHFALHLAAWLGFGITEQEGNEDAVLDLQEGKFTTITPAHGAYLDGRLAEATAELVHIQNAVSTFRVKLNQQQRRQLLQAYEQFYLYHISEFGSLRTLPVLEAVL
jgi:DNA repair protein RecO (recombination protein O)